MRNCLVAACFALICSVFVANAYSQQPAAANISGAKSGVAAMKQREGEPVKVAGIFRATGDRVAFYPDGGEVSFLALENLALERVAQSLTESRTPRMWDVQGVVTEYKGVNFLLLKHAVLRPLTGQP